MTKSVKAMLGVLSCIETQYQQALAEAQLREYTTLGYSDDNFKDFDLIQAFHNLEDLDKLKGGGGLQRRIVADQAWGSQG